MIDAIVVRKTLQKSSSTGERRPAMSGGEQQRVAIAP